MSVTWIQRVLRFLVCLKGRTTSDTCKCTSLKVSRDFRTQRTIRKRLFCSACVQSDTIGTRDSWLLNPEWDRLGSGLSIKTWAFHCQNVKLDESWEMRLYVAVVYYKYKAFSGSFYCVRRYTWFSSAWKQCLRLKQISYTVRTHTEVFIFVETFCVFCDECYLKVIYKWNMKYLFCLMQIWVHVFFQHLLFGHWCVQWHKHPTIFKNCC